MHYVCIENNQITAIQSYEPAVPSTVSVVTISDGEHAQIMAQTHRFDVASGTVVFEFNGLENHAPYQTKSPERCYQSN